MEESSGLGDGGPHSAGPDAVGAEVFDERVCASIRSAYERLPEAARPGLFAIACSEQYADMRAWLDEQIWAHDGRASIVERLRDERAHGAAVAELAVAHVLRGCAVHVEREPTLTSPRGRRTPDLVVRQSADGPISWFGEVWTRTVPGEMVRIQRRWAELGQSVAQVDVPRRVAVADDHLPLGERATLSPPGASQRARIRRELRAWLGTSPGHGETRDCGGLMFRVFGPSTTSSAEMVPVTGWTVLGRKHIVEAIEAKVRRYRALADDLDVPLAVILSGERDTGISADMVGDVLGGANSIAFTFGYNTIGSFDSGPIEIRQSDAPPRFHPSLSAVGLLTVNHGHDATLTVWPVPGARRPLPPLYGPNLEWHAR